MCLGMCDSREESLATATATATVVRLEMLRRAIGLLGRSQAGSDCFEGLLSCAVLCDEESLFV